MGLIDDFKAGVSELWNDPASFVEDSANIETLGVVPQGQYTVPPVYQSAPAPQTVYNGGNAPGSAPGGGNAFFAGLETLWSSPTAFTQDLGSVVTGGAIPDANYIPPKAGGSSFLAGLEELAQNPSQFFKDLPGLPSSTQLTVWGTLAVVGILGIAYISHKVF